MKLLKNNFWIPDSDTHFEKWFESTNWEPYQVRAILRALSCLDGHVTTAIDGGAHVGFITRILQYVFRSVKAFEPSIANFECLERNCGAEENTTLFNYALGQREQVQYLRTKEHNTGAGYVSEFAGQEIWVKTIDSYEFTHVHFIKLDIQGAEYEALLGAKETIDRDHPLLMIEDKDRDKIPQLLTDWDYINCANYKKDMFWKFKG